MEEKKTNQHAYVNKAVLDQEVSVIVQYLIIICFPQALAKSIKKKVFSQRIYYIKILFCFNRKTIKIIILYIRDLNKITEDFPARNVFIKFKRYVSSFGFQMGVH